MRSDYYAEIIIIVKLNVIAHMIIGNPAVAGYNIMRCNLYGSSTCGYYCLDLKTVKRCAVICKNINGELVLGNIALGYSKCVVIAFVVGDACPIPCVITNIVIRTVYIIQDIISVFFICLRNNFEPDICCAVIYCIRRNDVVIRKILESSIVYRILDIGNSIIVISDIYSLIVRIETANRNNINKELVACDETLIYCENNFRSFIAINVFALPLIFMFEIRIINVT